MFGFFSGGEKAGATLVVTKYHEAKGWNALNHYKAKEGAAVEALKAFAKSRRLNITELRELSWRKRRWLTPSRDTDANPFELVVSRSPSPTPPPRDPYDYRSILTGHRAMAYPDIHDGLSIHEIEAGWGRRAVEEVKLRNPYQPIVMVEWRLKKGRKLPDPVESGGEEIPYNPILGRNWRKTKVVMVRGDNGKEVQLNSPSFASEKTKIEKERSRKTTGKEKEEAHAGLSSPPIQRDIPAASTSASAGEPRGFSLVQ
ncbi:hypothetical protein BT69DRAFT_1354378 [Atractiella rhizophila]|nr:hypothetical protein BT69DRAFT_1354378 [Atractiella rhizophila]